MKKLALGALIAAMAACGGGGGAAGGGGSVHDGGGDDAAPVDAPPACNVFGTPGNQGCSSGQKCTWIVDNPSAETGHLGCATDGSAAVGAACSFSGSDGAGFDNCAAGGFCIGDSCEQICDPMGTSDACDSMHSCGTYQGIFGPPAGPDTAGVCDPTCDPLTQNASAPINGTTLACGSPHAYNCAGSGTGSACGSNGPELGCYPFLADGVATCANSPEARGMPPATDDIPCDAAHDCADSAGDAYPNGCAPGFIGFYFEMEGSMQVMCTGLCAPLEIDSARAANEQGDGSALGKLPTDPAPVAGHAACRIGGRAGKANEECDFVWPVLVESNITDSPYNDTLGVCFRPADFDYDPTGGSNDTTPIPPCDLLKPGTVAEAEANGMTNVACESLGSGGVRTGSNADCYAVEHDCYNVEDTLGSDLGSGSAAAAVRLVDRLSQLHYNKFHDFRLPLAGMMQTRRMGGIH